MLLGKLSAWDRGRKTSVYRHMLESLLWTLHLAVYIILDGSPICWHDSCWFVCPSPVPCHGDSLTLHKNPSGGAVNSIPGNPKRLKPDSCLGYWPLISKIILDFVVVWGVVPSGVLIKFGVALSFSLTLFCWTKTKHRGIVMWYMHVASDAEKSELSPIIYASWE